MRKDIQNVVRADFDILCDDFREDINWKEFLLPIVTIYRNDCKDYPGKFVARLTDIRPGQPISTRYIMLSGSVDELRGRLPSYMYRLDRKPNDDKVILETWI